MKNKTGFCATFNGNIPIIKITGELDHCVSTECRSIFADLAAKGHIHVIVEISELEYLDSSGMSAIIFSAKQLSELSGCLILVGGNPRVMHKFEIGGMFAFPDFVVKYHTMEEALRHLAKS